MERLIVKALPSKPGRFSGRLESTSEIIVINSKQPLADGARELLARGFDPAAPLTMRHDSSSHDSFAPLPIGKWAKLTYEERDNGGLTRARWMPRATPEEAQKSTSELSGVPKPPPSKNFCTKQHSGRPLNARSDNAGFLGAGPSSQIKQV
jgi:hypothetical protein